MLSTRRVVVAGIAFVLVFVIYSPAFNQESVVSGSSALSFKPSILYVKDFAGTDFMNKKLLVTDSSFILQSSGKDQGTLIVTVKIVNKLANLAPLTLELPFTEMIQCLVHSGGTYLAHRS